MNGTEVKFEPAIYGHKAALIGREPREVAMSAGLLAEAVLKEHEVYRADSEVGSKNLLGSQAGSPFDDSTAAVGTTYYY